MSISLVSKLIRSLSKLDLLEINFQNLDSSEVIKFLNFLSLKFLLPIKLISEISAFEPNETLWLIKIEFFSRSRLTNVLTSTK